MHSDHNPDSAAGQADLPSPRRALHQLHPPSEFPHLERLRGEKVLFYPGAGEDVSPALRFVQSGTIHTIVYCDYFASRKSNYPSIEKTLEHFECYSGMGEDRDDAADSWSQVLSARGDDPVRLRRSRRHHRMHRMDEFSYRGMGVLLAEDLGFPCRSHFFPSGQISNTQGSEIGVYADFYGDSDDGQMIRFYYLDTEAIQTYLHLWGAVGKAPHIVVVQNHGKGGLWTRLDGDGLLYAAAAKLPEFLWLGDIDSEPWPHYRQVSAPATDRHSMHHSTRTLWQCTLSDRVNPTCELPNIVTAGIAGSANHGKTSSYIISKSSSSHRRLTDHLEVDPSILANFHRAECNFGPSQYLEGQSDAWAIIPTGLAPEHHGDLRLFYQPNGLPEAVQQEFAKEQRSDCGYALIHRRVIAFHGQHSSYAQAVRPKHVMFRDGAIWGDYFYAGLFHAISYAILRGCRRLAYVPTNGNLCPWEWASLLRAGHNAVHQARETLMFDLKLAVYPMSITERLPDFSRAEESLPIPPHQPLAAATLERLSEQTNLLTFISHLAQPKSPAVATPHPSLARHLSCHAPLPMIE